MSPGPVSAAVQDLDVAGIAVDCQWTACQSVPFRCQTIENLLVRSTRTPSTMPVTDEIPPRTAAVSPRLRKETSPTSSERYFILPERIEPRKLSLVSTRPEAWTSTKSWDSNRSKQARSDSTIAAQRALSSSRTFSLLSIGAVLPRR